MDFHAWNLDRVQLERGTFYSYLDVLHTHNVQLGVTRRSIRLATHGEISPNAISFVMIMNDASIIQQKQKMMKHHLAVIEHGSEIDAVFVEPINFISVVINRELFYSKYEQKFHEVYPISKKFELRICNMEVLDFTKETLQSILKAYQANYAFYAVPENMTMLEEHIIDQILNVLYTSFVQHNESKWIETAYSLLGIIKARYDQDINIEMLCKELNVSQRSAYMTFQKHYGMTPKQYLLSIRLGKIKQAIELADPKSVKIEHIALQNGFYHMSHFAKMYKSFFGELPSKTLWKHKH